jgi:hypothetical protein
MNASTEPLPDEQQPGNSGVRRLRHRSRHVEMKYRLRATRALLCKSTPKRAANARRAIARGAVADEVDVSVVLVRRPMTLEVAEEGRLVRLEVIDLEIPHREREAVVDANINSPSSDARQNHYTVNNNISTPNADSFRKSQGQIAAEAGVHIQRMSLRNG